MTALQELAGKLLSEGAVGLVIGWEEGPRGARPAFVTRPEDAGRLIFDPRCVHNLAAYLHPRRRHLPRSGRTAVVVKGCDARSVAGLVRECQVKREDLVVIGVRCGGVVRDPARGAGLTAESVSDRCPGCEAREPGRADHLVGELPPAPPASTRRADALAALRRMSPAERAAFWDGHLSRCIRCYACREVCPNCSCVTCRADVARPQWIDPSPTVRGNTAWQMMRVLHQAGRCADCLECERACPADIPLGLLGKHLLDSVAERFDHRPTDDPGVAAPLGAYRTDDEEEFIL